MHTTPVIAAIDADAHLSRGMVGIFAGLRQPVDDELSDGDGFMNPFRFGVIRLGHHRMQTLIVKLTNSACTRCKIRWTAR